RRRHTRFKCDWSSDVCSSDLPHNNPDYAGNTTTARQTPPTMTNLRLTPGSTLTFDGVNGGANNLQSATLYDGDGNPNQVVNNLKIGRASCRERVERSEGGVTS